ncbi:MAG TPA: DUF3108 domain-containing protein [Candidatus Kapabacteria bacterium]|jgi:hypothetical protein
MYRRIFIVFIAAAAPLLWPDWLQHSSAAVSARATVENNLERSQQATGSNAFRHLTNEAFTVGERLTFDINYGFITAGQAVMSIPGYKYIGNRPTYEMRIEASSASTFDYIFKVRDRYETFLDVGGIFPWRFEQHVREGHYSHDYDAIFDPENQTARTSDGHTYTTPEYVHDIVSAFYYVRTLDLTHSHKGDIIRLENFYDGKVSPLDVRVLGHQQVETDAGTFECSVIEPMVVQGGLFKSEGSIKIWLTDDYNHIPVKMASKILIGEIEAKLVKYEGVRSPLTSKVE